MKQSAERAFANPKTSLGLVICTGKRLRGDGIVESVVIKNIKTGQLT